MNRVLMVYLMSGIFTCFQAHTINSTSSTFNTMGHLTNSSYLASTAASIRARNGNISEINVTRTQSFRPASHINSTSTNTSITSRRSSATKIADRSNILKKIHRTITRSKDAVWATISLTFLCVLLLIGVAQSKMWKHYRMPDSQDIPLPNFNERVLFSDVMKYKKKTWKQFFKKKKLADLEAPLLKQWNDELTSDDSEV